MKILLTMFLAFGLMACNTVGPGEKGVRVTLGSVGNEVLSSGVYGYFPFVTRVKSLNIQVQKSEVATSASSKDMQEITTKLAVNWSVNPSKVLETFVNIGDEEDVLLKVISPAVSESLKAATAKRTADDILKTRIEVKEDIDNALKARLEKYGVLVQDVSIVDLQFSHEFTRAIEEKQIAEQKAKQAEYDALRAEKEAIATVNTAKGQAQAQNLVKQTITSELLQLKAIEKWDGKFPQVTGGGALPFINLKPNEMRN